MLRIYLYMSLLIILLKYSLSLTYEDKKYDSDNTFCQANVNGNSIDYKRDIRKQSKKLIENLDEEGDEDETSGSDTNSVITVTAGNAYKYNLSCSINNKNFHYGDKHYIIDLIVYGPNRQLKAWRYNFNVSAKLLASLLTTMPTTTTTIVVTTTTTPTTTITVTSSSTDTSETSTDTKTTLETIVLSDEHIVSKRDLSNDIIDGITKQFSFGWIGDTRMLCSIKKYNYVLNKFTRCEQNLYLNVKENFKMQQMSNYNQQRQQQQLEQLRIQQHLAANRLVKVMSSIPGPTTSSSTRVTTTTETVLSSSSTRATTRTETNIVKLLKQQSNENTDNEKQKQPIKGLNSNKNNNKYEVKLTKTIQSVIILITFITVFVSIVLIIVYIQYCRNSNSIVAREKLTNRRANNRFRNFFDRLKTNNNYTSEISNDANCTNIVNENALLASSSSSSSSNHNIDSTSASAACDTTTNTTCILSAAHASVIANSTAINQDNLCLLVNKSKLSSMNTLDSINSRCSRFIDEKEKNTNQASEDCLKFI